METTRVTYGYQLWKGTIIGILNDPWIPGNDPYVHTSQDALQYRTVDALMVSNQNAWDIDLVKDIFVDRDIQLILAIPLQHSDEDSWYWNRDRLGHYIMKSAYAAL